jgi:hypothetical protein
MMHGHGIKFTETNQKIRKLGIFRVLYWQLYIEQFKRMYTVDIHCPSWRILIECIKNQSDSPQCVFIDDTG